MRSISDNLLLGAAGAATGPASYTGYALLALSGGTSGNYLAAFPFSSVSGFGSVIYAPSPQAFYNARSASFTKDGLAVVGSSTSGAYVFAFRWTGSSWGTQYSNPASIGSSLVNDLDVSPSNNFVCYPESNTFPVVYSWNSATGFGSRVRDTTNTVGTCYTTVINKAGTRVLFGYSASPNIRAFPVTSNSLGAPLSDPSSPVSSTVRGLAFNSTDSVLFACTEGSPYIHAYAWSNSTGFGSKYSNPSVLPNSLAFDCAFNPVGGSVAVIYAATPYIRAYPWSDSTGFGTAYSNPAAISANPNRVKFSPDGNAIVAVGALDPRIRAYRWSNISGFGTAYSSPTYTNETAFDIDFSPQL